MCRAQASVAEHQLNQHTAYAELKRGITLTKHIIQDLVDVAIALQRNKMKEAVRAEVSAAVENRILDILAGDAAQVCVLHLCMHVLHAHKHTHTHTYTHIHMMHLYLYIHTHTRHDMLDLLAGDTALE